MSVKRLMLCCAVVLAACSDNPVAPDAHDATTVSATPMSLLVAPSLDDHTARFEFYYHGQLKQVFRGDAATAPQSFDEFASFEFASLVSKMDERPANKRSAQLANLLRGLDQIPAATRAKVFESRAKQLTKETQHEVTHLADGTRVIDFYFDGQLAGRAVVPAPVTSAASTPAHAVGSPPQVIGRTTITTTDECDDCWTEADEVYYWSIITYTLDQAAALDTQMTQMVSFAPVSAMDISFEGNCLKAYFYYLDAAAQLLAFSATLGSDWASAAVKAVQLGQTSSTPIAAGAVDRLNRMWAAWNGYRDCLWKNW